MHAILRVIAVKQRLIALHSDVCGDVVRLGLTDQRVEQEAVHDLQRGLLDVLVRAVDGVAGLEADDCPPTPLRERGAGLRRVFAVGTQLRLQILALDDGDRASNEHFVLAVDGGDSGVSLVCCAEDVLGLFLLVVGVDLVHGQDAQVPAGMILEHDVVAQFQPARRIRGADRVMGRLQSVLSASRISCTVRS